MFALMYPLKWQHGYVPIVPEVLHSIAETPWPFVAGMNSKHAHQVPMPITFTEFAQFECPFIFRFMSVADRQPFEIRG
jgi:hypothetical protein